VHGSWTVLTHGRTVLTKKRVVRSAQIDGLGSWLVRSHFPRRALE